MTAKWFQPKHVAFILFEYKRCVDQSQIYIYIYVCMSAQKLRYLTLYVPCIILQYVYKPTRYIKFL